MPQIQKLPYRIPHQSHIQFGEWMVELPSGDRQQLEKIIPNWDPATELRASIRININYAGILSDCGFSENVGLRIASFWKSEGTFLKGCGEVIDLPSKKAADTDEKEFSLHIRVDGINLASSVELWVQLLVQSNLNDHKLFTAKTPGSILAQSIPYKVIIEGEGPRFPVEVIDFSATSYPSEAGWFLFWNPSDLYETVLGNLRLFINSKHQRITKAVTLALDDDFDIRETIRYDVARMLIHGALANEEFINTPDIFPDGSVGAAIRNLLHVYFPQTYFSEIKNRSLNLEYFDAELLNRLKIFWKES